MGYDIKKILSELQKINNAAIDLALDVYDEAKLLKPKLSNLKEKCKLLINGNGDEEERQ